ncbi:HAMP domain-containing protein, partial [Campylobacter sp. LR264d]|uniref:PDC sensor domain-containing protein n=2 Tax=Campylobacter TaxID=194 RepID=UPI00123A9D71
MNIVASIKNKLIIVVIALVIICITAISGFSYYQSKKAMFNLGGQSESDTLSAALTTISSFDSSNIALVEKIYNHISKNANSTYALKEFTKNMLKPYKDGAHAFGVYLGFENGAFIGSDSLSEKDGVNYYEEGPGTNNNTGYDARNEEWFKGALNTKGVYKTKVYQDSDTKVPVITYSKAIYNNNKLIAVLGVDMTLSDLQNEFNEIGQLVRGGRMFVFDEDKITFLSTDASLIFNDNPNIPMLTKAREEHGNLVPFYYRRANGTQRMGVCGFLGNSTSMGCLTRSLDSFEGPINKIAFENTIISLIMLIIVGIAIYMMTNYVLKPLQHIKQGLLSFFDYLNYKSNSANTINVHSKDELGEIAHAINENIQKTKKNLDKDTALVQNAFD